MALCVADCWPVRISGFGLQKQVRHDHGSFANAVRQFPYILTLWVPRGLFNVPAFATFSLRSDPTSSLSTSQRGEASGQENWHITQASAAGRSGPLVLFSIPLTVNDMKLKKDG